MACLLGSQLGPNLMPVVRAQVAARHLPTCSALYGGAVLGGASLLRMTQLAMADWLLTPGSLLASATCPPANSIAREGLRDQWLFLTCHHHIILMIQSPHCLRKRQELASHPKPVSLPGRSGRSGDVPRSAMRR